MLTFSTGKKYFSSDKKRFLDRQKYFSSDEADFSSTSFPGLFPSMLGLFPCLPTSKGKALGTRLISHPINIFTEPRRQKYFGSKNSRSLLSAMAFHQPGAVLPFFKRRPMELQVYRTASKNDQPRSQVLSSSRPRKRDRGDPGWGWSRVSQIKIRPRENHLEGRPTDPGDTILAF